MLSFAQVLIGVLILIAVMAGSFFYAAEKSEEKSGKFQLGQATFYFFGCLLAVYAGLGGVAGFFWVLAQIGIWMRQIAQWCLEAIFAPFINLLS